METFDNVPIIPEIIYLNLNVSIHSRMPKKKYYVYLVKFINGNIYIEYLINGQLRTKRFLAQIMRN